MKSKEEAINCIEKLLIEGKNVKATSCYSDLGNFVDDAKMKGWKSKTIASLEGLNNTPDVVMNCIKSVNDNYEYDVDTIMEQLISLLDMVKSNTISFEQEITEASNHDYILENLFNRFHKVARQLRTRHSCRETLKISDEYDVQDLLHALLLINFDDVREEEWTPSYAGGSARMDFLLKDIQTVIEVKKTRDSMTSRSLSDELIVDIDRYKVHPECKKLYCFVYDPEGLLGNPVGIKNDLEGAHGGFLKVIIVPN